MARVNGAQVAAVALARQPGLPVVFASRYSETAANEEVVESTAALPRMPFGVSDLEEVLGVALGTP
ncbi:hypothetical protein ACFZ8E_01590 [Methylobacterium sp. HMF5984]|uniref:hypothetical protein n=1 Tax=Methylobacterium sp. HMF5984 TaxID=3367370 RepID=UPI0038529B3C